MQHQEKMQIATDVQYWDLPWKVLGNARDIPKTEKSSRRSSLLWFPYFPVLRLACMGSTNIVKE